MVFAHDTEASLLAAVALVNSAEEPDTLTTVADLDAFYAEHAYTGSRDPRPGRAGRGPCAARPLRTLLTSTRDDAVGIVNRMLAEAGAVPQLVRHDGEDWHLHATDRTAPFATRIAVETAMAMVDVIRADEMSRLGLCADDDLRRRRAGPVPQPLPAVLQHRLRQPERRRRLPRPADGRPSPKLMRPTPNGEKPGAPSPWVSAWTPCRATHVAALILGLTALASPSPATAAPADLPEVRTHAGRIITFGHVARPSTGTDRPSGAREAKEARDERDVALASTWHLDPALLRPAPTDSEATAAARQQLALVNAHLGEVLHAYDEARAAADTAATEARDARDALVAAQAAAKVAAARYQADRELMMSVVTEAYTTSQIGALGLLLSADSDEDLVQGVTVLQELGRTQSDAVVAAEQSRDRLREATVAVAEADRERAGQARRVASRPGRGGRRPRPGARRRAHGPPPARGLRVGRPGAARDGGRRLRRGPVLPAARRARRSSTSTTGDTAAATGPRCTPATTSPPRAAPPSWPSTTAPW